MKECFCFILVHVDPHKVTKTHIHLVFVLTETY